MSADIRFELFKFEGNNHPLWKDMLDTALTAKGLLGYADGTISMPTRENEVSEWRRKDAEAKLTIHQDVGIRCI